MYRIFFDEPEATSSENALTTPGPTKPVHICRETSMSFDETASGVYAIAVTPFHDDGRLDWDSVDSMTDFYVGAGVTGLTILGIMGEAPKLDMAESLELTSRVIRRSAGLPVIVGVSAPGFAAMRSLAQGAMERGAAGVMIAPPPSLRTDDQIVGYYEQAVEAIGDDIPFVLQDYPLTLTVVMTPKVIRRVIQNHPSCRMLKHEDWPGLEKITVLRGFEADGSMRHISILTGNGALFLDFEMERGADGAMTGYAFPDMLADVVRLSKAGQRDAAHDLFDAHLPLIRYEQQQGVGLAVRKYVLHKRGAIRTAAQRKPASSLTAKAKTEVDYLLARLARHDPRAAV
jgi:4-hydroxy-tetrahydrodipicolinate synthase